MRNDSQRRPMMKVLGPPKKDAVWLLFEVTLEPGERAEVRPSSALRSKGDGRESIDVPVDSVKPFKAFRFGPIGNNAKSLASWTQDAGIVFTSVRLSEAEELAPGCEVPAWLISHGQNFSTSLSAADVVFTVENRGAKPIEFTGHIEGATLSEVAR